MVKSKKQLLLQVKVSINFVGRWGEKGGGNGVDVINVSHINEQLWFRQQIKL